MNGWIIPYVFIVNVYIKVVMLTHMHVDVYICIHLFLSLLGCTGMYCTVHIFISICVGCIYMSSACEHIFFAFQPRFSLYHNVA